MTRQAKDDYYRDEDAATMDFAAAINAELHDLVAAGADVVQLDEPWLRYDTQAAERIAVRAIDRALDSIPVPTIVHLCFGYAAVMKGQKPAGYAFLPQLADSVADQISIEAAQPGLDLGVLRELSPKTVVLGVLNLADPAVESPGQIAKRIRGALRFVDADKLVLAPDCGMKYLPRLTAFGKLTSLAQAASMIRTALQ